jgi:hypothetical protein
MSRQNFIWPRYVQTSEITKHPTLRKNKELEKGDEGVKHKGNQIRKHTHIHIYKHTDTENKNYWH